MLRIAICDDHKKTMEYVKNTIYHILRKRDQETEIDTYIGGASLWEAMNGNQHYDILFLDLYMPDMSGLDLGNKMCLMNPETLIIILSNREEYVFETFKMKPFRFIRKQKFQEEIEEVLLEAIEEIGDQNQPLWIQSGTVNYCLYIKKILWIESHDKQIEIVYPHEKTVFRYKISDMERELEDKGFVKIHRSILVNVRHIQSIHRNEILMDNGQIFLIARKQLEKVRTQMQDYIKWDMTL